MAAVTADVLGADPRHITRDEGSSWFDWGSISNIALAFGSAAALAAVYPLISTGFSTLALGSVLPVVFPAAAGLLAVSGVISLFSGMFSSDSGNARTESANEEETSWFSSGVGSAILTGGLWLAGSALGAIAGSVFFANPLMGAAIGGSAATLLQRLTLRSTYNETVGGITTLLSAGAVASQVASITNALSLTDTVSSFNKSAHGFITENIRPYVAPMLGLGS